MPPRKTPELKSHISPNSFLHIPSTLSSPSPQARDKYILFFIPGNPGLISYYHTFLSLLSDPKSCPSTAGCVVAGWSLGGFEIPDSEAPRNEDGFPSRSEVGSKVYSLQGQIALTATRLEVLVERLQKQFSEPEGTGVHRRWKVFLIGHSVGSFIALEVLRLQREKVKVQKEQWLRDGLAAAREERADGRGFEIRAVVLLTPTIVDIALSDSGRVAAPLLRYVLFLPLVLSVAAKLITRLLPGRWLDMVVRVIMGRDTPSEAVETTVSFLRSRRGVRQSLEMARDEMMEIGRDGWGEEVWGVVDEESSRDSIGDGEKTSERAEMVFYFARKDHWVADQTREAIVNTRDGKGKEGRPRMVVAEDGEVVHGWCIRHSGLVARQVDGWVEDIMKRI